MTMRNYATNRRFLLPPCFPEVIRQPGKQVERLRDPPNTFNLFEENGAGEAIRTPDPNLGKVVLYP